MEKKYKLTSYGESSIDKESQEELLEIVNSGSFPKITEYYLKKKGIKEIKNNDLGIEFNIDMTSDMCYTSLPPQYDFSVCYKFRGHTEEAEALKDLLNSLVKLDQNDWYKIAGIFNGDLETKALNILSNLRRFKEIKNGN